MANLPGLSLAFEPNVGQVEDPRVQFVVHAGNANVSIGAAGADLAIAAGDGSVGVVQMQLVGADPNVVGQAQDEQSGVSDYLLGNDSSQWLTDVPNFGSVSFANVLPGVDVSYHGNDANALEYDFTIHPGSTPDQVQLNFSGADSQKIDDQGNLVLSTKAGDLTENAPTIYQQVDGQKQMVGGGFVLEATGRSASRWVRTTPAKTSSSTRSLSSRPLSSAATGVIPPRGTASILRATS